MHSYKTMSYRYRKLQIFKNKTSMEAKFFESILVKQCLSLSKTNRDTSQFKVTSNVKSCKNIRF